MARYIYEYYLVSDRREIVTFVISMLSLQIEKFPDADLSDLSFGNPSVIKYQYVWIICYKNVIVMRCDKCKTINKYFTYERQDLMVDFFLEHLKCEIVESCSS